MLQFVNVDYSIGQNARIGSASGFSSSKGMEANLNTIRELYEDRRYEDAYDLFRDVYQANYQNVNESDKMVILDWGIRLSFINEKWADLDRYIDEYYSLDPYFSASSLKESSPQLQAYIGNFVRAKSERFVYVNKHKQNVDLIPASITVYTKDDIERLGARNLLDLIRMTPGFAELGDNNERVFGTRGTSSTSLQDILILINGHRISDIFTNTNGPDWLSLDYVEQIEIMKGPGSALYGENAFSGVINVVTKDGRFKNVNTVKVDLGNGNSFRDMTLPYNTYHVNYQYGRKLSNTEGVYVSASYYASGGAEIDLSRTEQNTVLPDAVRLDSISASGTPSFDTLRPANSNGREYINRYAPGYNVLLNYNRNALRLTANAQSSAFIYSRPTSLNLWAKNDPNDLRTRTRKDQREFVHLEYDLLDKSERFKHELKFKLGGDHFYKDIYFPAYSFGVLGNQRVEGDEFRGTTSLEFSSDSLMNKINGLPEQHLLVGVEGYFNHWLYNYYLANDTSFVLVDANDYFTEEGESRFEYIAAAYFQIDQHLVQDRLILTTGARLNYHSKYSTFDEFIWGKQFSPRFTMIYLSKLNKHDLHTFKAKVLYNSAFFPPPFLYRRGGILGFQGSDDLTVQRIESGELIFSGDVSPQFSYSALVYVNKIEDVIERVFVEAENQDIYINSPRAQRHAGVEFEVKMQNELERLKVNSFLNYSLTTRNDFINENQYAYPEAFNANNFVDGGTLSNYPSSIVNIGADLLTMGSKKSLDVENIKNKPQFSLGANVQWIGSSIVHSAYLLDENNALVYNPSDASTSSILPSSLVVNARLKVHFKKFQVGCSAYNITNSAYFLPNVSYASRRQYAEGRMIMLNFVYLFNVN